MNDGVEDDNTSPESWSNDWGIGTEDETAYYNDDKSPDETRDTDASASHVDFGNTHGFGYGGGEAYSSYNSPDHYQGKNVSSKSNFPPNTL